MHAPAQRLVHGILETALYVTDRPRAKAFYMDLVDAAPLRETPRTWTPE